MSSPTKSGAFSLGSPRSSPFRRPESPSRPTTPSYQSTRPTTPSRLHNSVSISEQGGAEPSSLHSRSRSDGDALLAKPSSPLRPTQSPTREQQTSPLRTSYTDPAPSIPPSNEHFSSSGVHSSPNQDLVSKIPPSQAREIREAFQVLDRNNDTFVEFSDIQETLRDLGFDTQGQTQRTYFPSPHETQLPLSKYLSNFASLLSPLSMPSELLAALSAFDTDDSGQIDIDELKRSLKHLPVDRKNPTKPLEDHEIDLIMEGFTGKRAFSKQTAGRSGAAQGTSQVFRYRDWVTHLGPTQQQNAAPTPAASFA